MILVDTSIWIDLFRDKDGQRRARFDAAVGDEEVVLCRMVQLELLQGARDEREWSLLKETLDTQDYLETGPLTWRDAARLFFDLRRQGLTVRSPVDCLIAQIAVDHDALLLHRDRDYLVLGSVSRLREQMLDWDRALD